jgi:hypothetical protein
VKRLGWLNVLDPLQPDRQYPPLDLSIHDERELVQMLAQLALQEGVRFILRCLFVERRILNPFTFRRAPVGRRLRIAPVSPLQEETTQRRRRQTRRLYCHRLDGVALTRWGPIV